MSLMQRQRFLPFFLSIYSSIRLKIKNANKPINGLNRVFQARVSFIELKKARKTVSPVLLSFSSSFHFKIE